MDFEHLLKEWDQCAADYIRLYQIGASAPLHHQHLHNAAKDQRARAETYTECAAALRKMLTTRST